MNIENELLKTTCENILFKSDVEDYKTLISVINNEQETKVLEYLEYILIPLFYKFPLDSTTTKDEVNTTKASTIEDKEHVMSCLCAIVEKLNNDYYLLEERNVFLPIFIRPVTILTSQQDGKYVRNELQEGTKVVALGLLSQLVITREKRVMEVKEKNLIGHTICLLLDAVKLDKSKQVKLLCLNVLNGLLSSLPLEFLITILPGTVVSLFEFVKSDYKNGSAIFISTLNCMETLLLNTTSDVFYEEVKLRKPINPIEILQAIATANNINDNNINDNNINDNNNNETDRNTTNHNNLIEVSKNLENLFTRFFIHYSPNDYIINKNYKYRLRKIEFCSNLLLRCNQFLALAHKEQNVNKVFLHLSPESSNGLLLKEIIFGSCEDNLELREFSVTKFNEFCDAMKSLNLYETEVFIYLQRLLKVHILKFNNYNVTMEEYTWKQNCEICMKLISILVNSNTNLAIFENIGVGNIVFCFIKAMSVDYKLTPTPIVSTLEDEKNNNMEEEIFFEFLNFSNKNGLGLKSLNELIKNISIHCGDAFIDLIFSIISSSNEDEEHWHLPLFNYPQCFLILGQIARVNEKYANKILNLLFECVDVWKFSNKTNLSMNEIKISTSIYNSALFCLASCSFVLKLKFKNQLVLALFPILEALGNQQASFIANQCLAIISKNCKYLNIQELLEHNLDYIVDEFIRRLSFSSGLDNDNLPVVLESLLTHVIVEWRDNEKNEHLTNDLLEVILECLDNSGNNYRNVWHLLKILTIIVRSLRNYDEEEKEKIALLFQDNEVDFSDGFHCYNHDEFVNKIFAEYSLTRIGENANDIEEGKEEQTNLYWDEKPKQDNNLVEVVLRKCQNFFDNEDVVIRNESFKLACECFLTLSKMNAEKLKPSIYDILDSLINQLIHEDSSDCKIVMVVLTAMIVTKDDFLLEKFTEKILPIMLNWLNSFNFHVEIVDFGFKNNKKKEEDLLLISENNNSSLNFEDRLQRAKIVTSFLIYITKRFPFYFNSYNIVKKLCNSTIHFFSLSNNNNNNEELILDVLKIWTNLVQFNINAADVIYVYLEKIPNKNHYNKLKTLYYL